MGRQHSSNSFDRNLYVLQPQNGGSGCITEQELKEKYGYAQESDLNAPGGILAYDEFGRIETSIFPEGTKFEGSIGLKGPKEMMIGASSSYIIVNYDPDTNYEIEFKSGIVERDANIITITAINNSGESWIKVNGQEFPILIKDIAPNKAELFVTAIRVTQYSSNIYYSLNEYFISNASAHESTQIQVSKNSDFTDIILDEKRIDDKTSGQVDNLLDGVYYLRARFISGKGTYGSWSEVIALDTSVVGYTLTTPSPIVKVYREPDSFMAVLKPEAFVETGTGSLTAVQWEISADINFSSIIDSRTKTSLMDAELRISLPKTYDRFYFRNRFLTSKGEVRAWSTAVVIDAYNIHSETPRVETAVITRPILENGTGLGYGLSISPSGKNIIASAVTGALVIFEKIDNQWSEKAILKNPYYGDFGWRNKFSRNEDVLFISGKFGASDEGGIFIYKKIEDQWVFTDEVRAPEFAEDKKTFGHSFDFDDSMEWLVIGEPHATVNGVANDGTAWLFKNINGKYSLIKDLDYNLIMPDKSKEYVRSYGTHTRISADGTYIAISSRMGSGSIPILKRIGDNWIVSSTIDYTYLLNRNSGEYGIGMDMSRDGNYIAVGAHTMTLETNYLGGGHIYKRNSDDSWSIVHTITGKVFDSYNRSGPCRLFSFNSEATLLLVGDEYSRVGNITSVASGIVFKRTGDNWRPDQKLNKTQPVQGAQLSSLAMAEDGKHAYISSNRDSVGGVLNTGSIVEFSIQTEPYSYIQKILSPTPSVRSAFGITISAAKTIDRIVIAASNETLNGELPTSGSTLAGKVNIFDKINGIWVKSSEIFIANIYRDNLYGGASYGIKISEDGKTLVFQNNRINPSNAGITDYFYSFYRINDSGTWIKETELDLPYSNYNNVWRTAALTTDGSRFVGFYRSTKGLAGGMIIGRRNSSGVWAFEFKEHTGITEVGADAEPGFGAMTPDGQYLIASIRYGMVDGVKAGKALVYKYENNNYVLKFIINKPTATTGSFAMDGVSISGTGDILAMGDYSYNQTRGLVYIFKRTNESWMHTWTIDGSDLVQPGAKFGVRVLLNQTGNKLIISAQESTVDGLYATGEVFLYHLENDIWVLKKILRQPIPSINANFGSWLEADKDFTEIFIGAFRETNNGINETGSVYMLSN